LDNSISCFEIYFEGLKVGKIIPFPVWIIPLSVLKINFELLGTNENPFEKEVF